MYSTDRELIAAMLAGDEAAFRSFFTAYFPRVYRFALPRLNGEVEAAKEVVQSTLTKAMRNLAGYRGEAALFSWLCQICRRQIVDYLRANKRHSENVVLIDDSAELRAALEAVEAPAADDPLHGYGSAETRRLVQSVLDRLPARYGDVLEWKYIEGRSVRGNRRAARHRPDCGAIRAGARARRVSRSAGDGIRFDGAGRPGRPAGKVKL